MFRKRTVLIILCVALITGATACTRSVQSTTKTPATPSGANPKQASPAVTNEVMAQLMLFATQTAISIQAQQTAQAPLSQAITATLPSGAPLTPQPDMLTPVAPPAVAPAQPPAVQPTQIIPPTPTPGLPVEYILQQGEHPYCIARRFNVNPGEMLNLSGLSGNTFVYPGMTLKIPQSGSPFPSARSLRPHPTTYTVSNGETIFSIACQFGDVDPYAIAYVNNLQEPYKISAGQVLQIP